MLDGGVFPMQMRAWLFRIHALNDSNAQLLMY